MFVYCLCLPVCLCVCLFVVSVCLWVSLFIVSVWFLLNPSVPFYITSVCTIFVYTPVCWCVCFFIAFVSFFVFCHCLCCYVILWVYLSLPFLPFFLILGISYCLAVFLIPCLYQFQFVFLQFIIFSLSHSLPWRHFCDSKVEVYLRKRYKQHFCDFESRGIFTQAISCNIFAISKKHFCAVNN